MGFAFETPEGESGKINWSITIENGDYVGVLAAIKEQGGVYLPSQDGGKSYLFLPWPCAAVRICPVKK
jgi:hypothetical protein